MTWIGTDDFLAHVSGSALALGSSKAIGSCAVPPTVSMQISSSESKTTGRVRLGTVVEDAKTNTCVVACTSCQTKATEAAYAS
ncbi:MAG TPA: hypothetical protein DDW52_00030 [Planctomycetaceae bacterium]|nr:hypothetical protein [Planctomycetaceae bacterium]